MARLEVEIFDGTTAVGGPISHVGQFTHTWRMDLMGSFQFTMPATHARSSLVQPKRYAQVYAWVNSARTLVGGGVIESVKRQLRGQRAPILQVRGDDMLNELSRVSVEALTLSNTTSGPTNVMAKAVTPALPVSWSGAATTAQAVSYAYRHENCLEALIMLAEKTGEHFRLSGASSRTLTWLGLEASFADSGVLATNTVEPLHVSRNDKICLVTDIEESEENTVVNRVYPFGGSSTTLTNVTKWPDGTAYAGGTHVMFGDTYSIGASGDYLQNDTSVTAFSSRFDARLDRGDIKPLGAAQSDLDNASNLLLSEAFNWMRTRSQAEKFYQLTVAGLDTQVGPGELMRVLVRQFARGDRVIDIDALLNVTEVAVSYDNVGRPTHRLGVSTVDRLEDSDRTLARRQARQIGALVRG